MTVPARILPRVRVVFAAAAVLLAGSLAACGLVEGLSSYSEGACAGGDCDAGTDATVDASQDTGAAEAALDSSAPAPDAAADAATDGPTNPPDAGRVSSDGGLPDGSDGGGCGACSQGCCNGGTRGVCEPFASQTAGSCGAGGATCQACATGQTCDSTNGQCICTPSSCPNGCCNGSTCVPYASQAAGTCGAGGAACGPCLSGQDCSTTNGQCLCDATSCPHGCCNGATCVAYAEQTPGQCGTGGVSCAACANAVCDTTSGSCTCDSNTCPNGCCNGGATGTCELYASESTGSCGVGAATCSACGGGTECDKTSGKCVCDANSCPNGCCNGNTCVAYSAQSTTECGTAGAACAPCGGGQTCSSGVCSCGGSTCNGCCNGSACLAYASETTLLCGASGATCQPCGSGLDCNTSNGQCVCDPSSCASGCCNGNVCVPYASEQFGECGTGGVSCSSCGTGQACSTTNGTCICDAASCPNGCCDGNTCVAYAVQSTGQCGTGGATCSSCANGLCDTTNGTCSCDAHTCPDGCCSGGLTGTCEAYSGMSISSCGAGGATCAGCNGGCCSTGTGGTCDTQHSTGTGQSYYDCSPLDTYSAAEAQLACVAYALSVGGQASSCSDGWECSGHGQVDETCYAPGDMSSTCTTCWVYVSGSYQGWVTNCTCPDSGSKIGTWN